MDNRSHKSFFSDKRHQLLSRNYIASNYKKYFTFASIFSMIFLTKKISFLIRKKLLYHEICPLCSVSHPTYPTPAAPPSIPTHVMLLL